PKDQAIRYLAADDPRKHYVALRPTLQDKDPATLAEAATVLGGDLQSREKIKSLLSDVKQPSNVRVAAASSLAIHDPNFPQYATPLIAKTTEDPSVRTACLNQLNVGLQYKRYGENHAPAFADAVKSILGNVGDQDASVLNAATKAAEQLNIGPG